MMLRYSLLFTMLFYGSVFFAEDLDTLLNNLAKAQTSAEPEATTTPAEPKAKAETIDKEPDVQVRPKVVAPEPRPFVPRPLMPKPIVGPSVEAPKAPEAPRPAVPVPVMQRTEPKKELETVEKKEPKIVIESGQVSDVTQQGLDTLHIDSSGNWLEKRIWYEKSEQVFEEIRKVLEKASDARMKFVHEVSVIGKHIDDFYEKVSFEKGQIDELLQAVLGSLTTEQKVRGGDLSSGERSVKLKVHENQQELQSIETQMKIITSLDEQVEKTMIKAFNEIDACRAFETKAWNNFKEIGVELDDKKARTLYYEIENYYKNIQKKLDYLENNLYHYLVQQLGSKITQTTSEIEATIASLKTKGVDLETILKKDEAGDFEIFKEREKEQVQEDLKKAEQAAKEKETKSKVEKKVSSGQTMTWYQSLWCKFVTYFCIVSSKLYDWGSIVLCCIQTLLCKLQCCLKNLVCTLKEFICKFF